MVPLPTGTRGLHLVQPDQVHRIELLPWTPMGGGPPTSWGLYVHTSAGAPAIIHTSDPLALVPVIARLSGLDAGEVRRQAGLDPLWPPDAAQNG